MVVVVALIIALIAIVALAIAAFSGNGSSTEVGESIGTLPQPQLRQLNRPGLA